MPSKQSGLEIAVARIEDCLGNDYVGLDLSGLGLDTLPPQIGTLRTLRALRIDHNKLRTLPAVIGELTALQHLSLGHNLIRHLPEQIRALTALWDVDLSNNGLMSLPTSILTLHKLIRLDLSSNRIETLPREISTLRSLASLDLTSNALKSLPAELSALPDLQRLYLHDNPKLGVPVELLGPSNNDHDRSPKPAREILASYSRIAGEAGSTLGECKIIVVGRGQAGKTSLVKRLRGAPYDPHEPETHGITIQKLTLKGQNGEVKGRVWDFGGQVVLHSMHEFFLTARSLYLLVLGERDDMLERDAAYWLQLIRSYAGDAPVIVALNKSSGRQRQFDRGTLEKDYGRMALP